MYKKKQAHGRGPPREQNNKQENEMDIRKIMEDVQNFSNSHMTWKERKKVEDRKVVSLGGKPLKNQRLPLSVARPMMKKQKQREEKMLQEVINSIILLFICLYNSYFLITAYDSRTFWGKGWW